jgi:outer membrane protein assembly factor BamB
VHFDGFDLQYAVALDKSTGRTVWRSDRTHDFGTDDGDQKKGFATPVVIEASGRAQLISPAAKAVLSLDPLTGRELWRVRYPAHSAAARPLFAHGLVYVASGRGPAELLAIRPDGQGDVTETHVAWKAFRGIGASPSPVLVGDYVYTVTDKAGVITCLNAKTGTEVWQKRVGGGAHTASPLFADGALYFFGEDGSAVTLEPGPESRELGRGTLAEGGVIDSRHRRPGDLPPDQSHLYRLEAAEPPPPRRGRSRVQSSVGSEARRPDEPRISVHARAAASPPGRRSRASWAESAPVTVPPPAASKGREGSFPRR